MTREQAVYPPAMFVVVKVPKRLTPGCVIGSWGASWTIAALKDENPALIARKVWVAIFIERANPLLAIATALNCLENFLGGLIEYARDD